jgi:hypothetical protein
VLDEPIRPWPFGGEGSSRSQGMFGGTIMDPAEAQEISERDQLWASLRAIRPEIDRLAAGEWETTERQRQVVTLLARIVLDEMDFRARDATLD